MPIADYVSNFRRRAFHKPAVRYLFLIALFFSLLYVRRSIQLLHPQVWDEDGTQVLPALLDHGLKSLFYPVNGYLILVPKLISAISLAVSGIYYPLVSTIITWAFIVGVCVAIAVCPIWLKWGTLLGMATLLIPTDPEVFGIPLYSFWWASLLLFLTVLWDEKSTDLKLRACFVLLGGLSSPIIFLVAPFLIGRAIIFRTKRQEKVIAALALFCCSCQGIALFHSAGNLSSGNIDERSLRYVMPEFLGGYLVGNFNRTSNNLVWFATGFFVSFFLMTIPFLSKRPRYLTLLGLWGGAIYLIGRRVDLSLLQTRFGAPRYFFLPFVLVSWFLISVLAESERRDIKWLTSLLLLISVLNMLPVRTRPQTDFHWKEAVYLCSGFVEYPIPISFDGRTSWVLKVNRQQCAALQHAGLINIGSHLP